MFSPNLRFLRILREQGLFRKITEPDSLLFHQCEQIFLHRFDQAGDFRAVCRGIGDGDSEEEFHVRTAAERGLA